MATSALSERSARAVASLGNSDLRLHHRYRVPPKGYLRAVYVVRNVGYHTVAAGNGLETSDVHLAVGVGVAVAVGRVRAAGRGAVLVTGDQHARGQQDETET